MSVALRRSPACGKRIPQSSVPSKSSDTHSPLLPCEHYVASETVADTTAVGRFSRPVTGVGSCRRGGCRWPNSRLVSRFALSRSGWCKLRVTIPLQQITLSTPGRFGAEDYAHERHLQHDLIPGTSELIRNARGSTISHGAPFECCMASQIDRNNRYLLFVRTAGVAVLELLMIG